MESHAPGSGPTETERVTTPLQTRLEDRYLVVGGRRRGRALAASLATQYAVHHVDTDPDAIDRVRGYDATHVPDEAGLVAHVVAHVTPTDPVVVLADTDASTLLRVQRLRTSAALERVYAVLSDPGNACAFDIPDVEVVCPGDAIAAAIATGRTVVRAND